jgi:hypothetical protein
VRAASTCDECSGGGVAALPARRAARFFRVDAEAWPLRGGFNATPARRAFDSPIAIACFADRAPCLPSAHVLDLFANELSCLS